MSFRPICHAAQPFGKCVLGFEIENIDILDGEYGAGSVSVSFTDLKVLSHDIKDLRLVNKENGFFNQW